MKMTNEQIIRALEDSLSPNYAYDFKILAETDDMIFLQAVAGSAEDMDGQILDYRVHKMPDFVEDGYEYYMVEYRPMTGWADDPHAEWRWSTHIQA
jgi:hypothetical protein